MATTTLLMKTFICRNKFTHEARAISGCDNIGQVWNISRQLCAAYGWNIIDFTVTIK